MIKSFDNVWEEIHKCREWGQYPNEAVIRFIARNYYHLERTKVKILDFGCGGGANTWYLAREGFDTYSFDGSETAVKKTRKKLEKESLYANIDCYDALRLPYPNDYFDAVIDAACVYCNTINDIKKMYEKIYAVLKPGGKLFTSCFGKKTDGYKTGKEIEEDTFENITYGKLSDIGKSHFYDKQGIELLLRQLGFIDIIVDVCYYTDDLVATEVFNVVATKRNKM